MLPLMIALRCTIFHGDTNEAGQVPVGHGNELWMEELPKVMGGSVPKSGRMFNDRGGGAPCAVIAAAGCGKWYLRRDTSLAIGESILFSCSISLSSDCCKLSRQRGLYAMTCQHL